MEELEFISLSNLPCVMGEPEVNFIDKGYPEEIYSFGVGKQTGGHTSLRFTMPLSYSGEMALDNAMFDLFKFPEKGIGGKDLFNMDKPIYLMLRVAECDNSIWFLDRPRDNKAHVVKKIFNAIMQNVEE